MADRQPLLSRGERAQQRRIRIARWVVLLVILLISTTLGLLHQLLPYGKAPVGVDALCPFGGIESAFTLISTGAMIQRIYLSSFILLAAVLITAILFRRAFCGYICPLGTLQEIFSRLGRRIFKRAYRLPAAVDRPARWLKYVVLVVVVIGSARTADLIIRPYDPWAAYHHLASNELWLEFSWGVGVLIATLLGAVVFNRVFCKYLCPMGALLGLLSFLSWTRVRRRPETCIQCGRCDQICPVDLKVSSRELVTSPECLDCHECVNVCPVPETLVVETRRRRQIAAGTVLVAVTAIFLGTVGLTSAAKLFNWTTVSIAAEVGRSGAFDPALVRGKMIFGDVIAASGVPEAVVTKHFDLTPEDLRAPIRDVGVKRGFGAEDVRDFLADYLAGQVPEARQEREPSSPTAAFDPESITGTMTLEELAEASGIPADKLLAELSVSEAERNTPLKDLKERYPLDTQAVREAVRRLGEKR
jgi:polyferredoxin